MQPCNLCFRVSECFLTCWLTPCCLLLHMLVACWSPCGDTNAALHDCVHKHSGLGALHGPCIDAYDDDWVAGGHAFWVTMLQQHNNTWHHDNLPHSNYIAKVLSQATSNKCCHKQHALAATSRLADQLSLADQLETLRLKLKPLTLAASCNPHCFWRSRRREVCAVPAQHRCGNTTWSAIAIVIRTDRLLFVSCDRDCSNSTWPTYDTYDSTAVQHFSAKGIVHSYLAQKELYILIFGRGGLHQAFACFLRLHGGLGCLW